MEISMSELADILCQNKPAAEVATTTTTAPQNVIIRTVTHYYTGSLIQETDKWLYLSNCAWIADTGRWSDALATGTLVEVEPYPADSVVRVSVGAVVDLAPWTHELPKTKK